MKRSHPVLNSILVLAFGLAMACQAAPDVPAAATWHRSNGYRYRDLAVGPQGRTGFTLLLPDATGLDFTNRLTDARAAENQIRLNGSGVALGDVDGDGRCDIYFCGLEATNALYLNLGQWRFARAIPTGGMECETQFSTGATFVDIDGDDDLDLLVNGIGEGTRLFLNSSGGKFLEAIDNGLTRRYGAMTSALGDGDGDGDLDLYAVNYRTTTIRTTGSTMLNVGGKRMILPEDRDRLEITADGRVLEHGEADFLYRNDGGGRFSVRSWTDGSFLDEEGKALSRPPFDWGLSAMFRDLNGDGAPDLYVCNDFHSIDRIWLNDGAGRFRAIPRLALRHVSTFSMAVDVADLNRDGWDDIFVADMLSLQHSRRLMQLAGTDPYPSNVGVFDDRPQYDRNTLHLNRGDGTYVDVACFTGLEASEWTWSASFLDVDLDGYEDLLCTTGHMFDTQDLDAQARIDAMGPWRRDLIPQKLLQLPRAQMRKVAFHNRRDLTFTERGANWGFDQTGVAHGMAQADLDGDGDLDVVVNNLNGAAGIYRNESAASRVAVKLKGLPPNTRGIGAKIRVYGGAVPMQSQEMICGGRYLSSDDSMRVFAAGNVTNAMRIEVNWRSGKRSVINGVTANRLYEIDESGAEVVKETPKREMKPMFEEASGLPKHRHIDEKFNDFERQPLLPRKLSQLGPGVAWHDVDGDGWEDLIIGGGKGGKLAAYRNDSKGGFKQMTNGVLERVVTRDQTGVLGHGKEKILVGSASYEDGLAAGTSVRQYDLTNGRIDDTLPGAESSTGPLALADVDGDGDLDLFVGGRVVPGKYPSPASSRLFRNDAGRFVLDTENSRALEKVGLVSGAVFSDLDGDSKPELVLACEWGPIRIFKNKGNKLLAWDAPVTNNQQPTTLNQLSGWWTGVTTGDFDNDGRLDIVAGNWGRNTPYQSHRVQPLKIYYGDLAGAGTMELIEAYYDPVRSLEMPWRSLEAVGRALPWVRERFPTYHAYDEAALNEVLGERRKNARTLEANRLESTLFLNRGGRLEVRPLPAEAQMSPAFAVCVGDYDGDGNEDVFLSQNFFAVRPEDARYDGGRGLWLRGDGNGNFTAMPSQESGVKVYGEQRGAALCDYDADGRVDLAVTQNGAGTKLFRNAGARAGLRVRLNGSSGNPNGVGARLRLRYGQGQGPAREIHAGSGYWSQDSAIQILGTPEPPTQIQVVWPDGKRVSYVLPPHARETQLNPSGEARTFK